MKEFNPHNHTHKEWVYLCSNGHYCVTFAEHASPQECDCGQTLDFKFNVYTIRDLRLSQFYLKRLEPIITIQGTSVRVDSRYEITDRQFVGIYDFDNIIHIPSWLAAELEISEEYIAMTS